MASHQAQVSSIEVRECDAKRPHEIQDKAIFLAKLSGDEDAVNAKLRREMGRWLADAAEGVIRRHSQHVRHRSTTLRATHDLKSP